ncbi:MAG: ACP S-malonyltransferase [Gordonia sp.]|uniref:ACP S-malonyltransferase n=1 Tax=Gordonia sp. (in: high G+C Gram-positive bacteria) TaxID=84139 RepID=UPI001D3DF5E6|nr:ACP S-malonyltransferase [Gordonia sp. (in: high G+C Gram-positive bacteria)]MCB1295682.1 ACP S-malonyltransferase [Gordonia sp. (in: high G+C Gram-positive bacteria)]HMS75111.1 ACP S-malonyltransferase [Gordonia sp. (in: high G+C Gram-positive bacteria)]HQV18466.1 ACP S-malonyltransferase [Gordonia sp. (in: high G+C Gram-positive bacteria)]
MLSIFAPGQGSQTPGMLAPWLELPGARDQIALWSKLASLDLERLGTTATADEITDTAVTQPLIVAASLIAFDELSKRGVLPDDTVVAGHSVGELTAAAIAGVISADEAVTLAAVRGDAMAQACAIEPTTMAAVLGGDEGDVLDRLAGLGLVPANRNAKGQIVAAGAVEAIDELVANPPEKARVRKLAVAGAFHTEYMASAREAVAEAASAITPADPTTTLLSNSDGLPVTNGADALNKLVGQVTRPVRWDLCLATLRDSGTAAVVELPPAGTLVGIARRELKGVPSRAIKAPEDLDSL